MFKKIANKIIASTGYELRKKKPDALEANKLYKVDSDYADEKFINKYHSESREKFYREVVNLVKKENPRGVVADVGCGTGHLIRLIKDKLGVDFVGFDFSREAIEYAKKLNAGSHFEVKDIFSLPHKRWSMVICTEVLEHLEYPREAAEELIKRGEKVLITVPDGRHDNHWGHINFWSPESWEIFIKSLGYPYKTGKVLNDNYAIIYTN